jgi:hypothetical protein
MARPHTPLVVFVFWVALRIVKRVHIGIGFVLDPLLGMFCLFAGWLCGHWEEITHFVCVCKIWVQFVWLWPLGRDKRETTWSFITTVLVCWLCLCSFGKRLLLCIGVRFGHKILAPISPNVVIHI